MNKSFKYKKECKICNKTFDTNTATSKYCSDECRAIANKNRTYKLICEECGEEFDGKNKTNKFCSDECRRKNIKERYEVVCSECGVVYKAPIDLKHYPCKECREIIENSKVEKICRMCGEIFKTNENIEVCSGLCEHNYKRENKYKYNINIEEVKSIDKQIKELLLSYSGVRLNKKEQTEIYKQIKEISNLPIHKSIYKNLKRYNISHTYFDTVDGWSPLLINTSDEQDIEKQILIEVKKELLQQTINKYEITKREFEMKIENIKQIIKKLEN